MSRKGNNSLLLYSDNLHAVGDAQGLQGSLDHPKKFARLGKLRKGLSVLKSYHLSLQLGEWLKLF